jgi:hypothetical protein
MAAPSTVRPREGGDPFGARLMRRHLKAGRAWMLACASMIGVGVNV